MKQTENVLLRLDLSLYACVKLSPTKKKKRETTIKNNQTKINLIFSLDLFSFLKLPLPFFSSNLWFVKTNPFSRLTIFLHILISKHDEVI
jgi:hypothetical protein